MNDGDLQIQFLLEADERDHDFGFGLETFLRCIGGGFEHSASLHASDFGILDAETAATETKHRVELVQLVDARHDFFDWHVELAGKIHLRLF